MAGYIMNLDSNSSLIKCFETGSYSTKISLPKQHKNCNNKIYSSYWERHQEGTLADYSTMNPGDNIYFFINRKIYGIGKLTNINGECAFNNFPNSSAPILINYSEIKSQLLVDFDINSPHHRWICIFEPSPHFFKNGIDIDDILSSNPSKFKMLRAFWRLSFIKIDDEENKALRDVLLKYNQDTLENPNKHNCFEFNKAVHNEIINKITIPEYSLSVRELLSSCSKNDILAHEMALEAGTLYQLNRNIGNSKDIFGTWDYLSHQVISSPLKPIGYMDKMDIFGYKYIPNHFGTISKFLVIELKKDNAKVEDINQILKYVDWINQEYSFGDYSMIEAFLVAKNISNNVIEARNNYAKRNYIIGRRPPKFSIWTNLKLVTYSYNQSTGKIDYNLI
ncbi:hypothetical protein [Clostridium thermobutyricum]|uniref:hypothetical protein n=1 Tax=Clostridium thermobutyricum TaxID=29372 RepID=UPI0018AC8815|nr:hypothetical protein [Clostridium thermobutyricum]